MLYVSKVNKERTIAYITDTKSGVTKRYRCSVLFDMLMSGKFPCEIYGTILWDDEVSAHALTLNKRIVARELKHRILECRRDCFFLEFDDVVSDSFYGMYTKFYLFEAKVGIAITASVDMSSVNGRSYNVRFVKIDEDTWQFSNGFCSNKELANFLLVNSVVALSIEDGNRSDSVTITERKGIRRV